MTNTPDKSEMKACPSIDVRASILTTIKANREAGESQEVLARDLTTLFHKLFALSRPPADQVPDMVEMKLADLHKAVAAEFPSDEFVFSRQRAIDLALAVHMKIAALQAVSAASSLGELLLHGTLSMTKRQVIVDFDSRERTEAFFEALERAAQASGEE